MKKIEKDVDFQRDRRAMNSDGVCGDTVGGFAIEEFQVLGACFDDLFVLRSSRVTDLR